MTTYYVSSESGSNNNAGTSAGAPLATLQAAANLVQPGDTVEVMNGTYTGPGGGYVLDITTNGTASAPITFEAAPGQTPVINSSGSWYGINIQASNIVVSGFTVVGDAANYTLAQAMAGYGPNNASLDGNGISVVGSGGNVPNHVTIENNTVYNEPGGGIGTANADYVQILNNVVHNNANWSEYGNSGISIYQSANSDTNPGVHDVISGNLVYGNAEQVPENYTGQILDGEGIILDTNTNYTGEILVENNTVYNNGSAGIESFLTNNAVITQNTVYGNSTVLTTRPPIFINQANDTVTNNILTAPNATSPPAPVTTPTSDPPAAVTTPTSDPAAAVTTPTSDPPAAVTTPTSDPPATVTTPTSDPPAAVTTPTSDPPAAVTTPTSDPPAAVTTPTSDPAAMVSSLAESPASGDLDAGKTVRLTVNFSDAVTVAGGMPTLTLNDGGTATYTGGSGSSALTFSYTAAAGQNTEALAATAINPSGATITNAGNAANLSLSGVTQTGPLIDTAVPLVPVITNDIVNANNSVALTGTAEANTTVTIYDGSTDLGATTVGTGGAWSYTTGTLSSGTQTFTGTATDAAGNTSPASNAVDPVITQPPTGSNPAVIGNNTIPNIHVHHQASIQGPDKRSSTFAGTTGGSVSGFGAETVHQMASNAQSTLGHSANGKPHGGGALSVTNGMQSAQIALLSSYMASSFVVPGHNNGDTPVVTPASHSWNQLSLVIPHHS